jgi:hypothetical protein
MPNIPLNNFLKNVLDEAIKEGHVESARRMLTFSKGSFKDYDKYDAKLKELESKRTKTHAKG